MTRNDRGRPGEGGPEVSTTTRTTIPAAPVSRGKAPSERVEWKSNGATVTVGAFPLGGIALDLGDGVKLTLTGDLFEATPGDIIAPEGTRVTITGRLSTDAVLRLTRDAR